MNKEGDEWRVGGTIRGGGGWGRGRGRRGGERGDAWPQDIGVEGPRCAFTAVRIKSL